MKRNCEFIDLGEFEMTSPVMRVSDPCYERDVWCCGTLDHCKLGTWEAGVLKTDESEWGTRCAVLAVRHMDLFDFNHDGEVSDLERIMGLAAVLSEANPDVEISVTVGEDEDYGRELVSFRGMDLSRWETIAEVSDWSIRFELSKKSYSMYLFEIDTVSFENAGQP